ncbi:MAG: VanW family protein [Defluviitaleaceae bacterium]|nr:VanW family protein [Defluviitaleaceae bacterium]
MKKILYISLTSALSILIIIGVIILTRHANNSQQNQIAQNVFAHGVALGGLTEQEALSALTERFQPALASRTVRYLKDGVPAVELSFLDFETCFDFSAIIEEAFTYSRGKQFRTARILRRSHEIDTIPEIIFCAECMEKHMRALSQKLDITAKNASFHMEGRNKITVNHESMGYGVNTEAAAAATREVLYSMVDGDVDLQILEIAPLYTTADFNFDVAVLGAYQTLINTRADSPRRRNIERAAERINNYTIYPNEVFSAAALIDANAPDSGYEPATVIMQGEAVEDIGGGICQLVTTLYNAVIYAELEVIQRNNHSIPVRYVDVGFDATVAGDYFDLKFKNTLQTPVLVTSYVRDMNLHVEIRGEEVRDSSRSIRFETKHIERTEPEPVREIVDPNVPRGERLVTQQAQPGYHVELYKRIFINGNEIGQVKINSSVYKPVQGVVAIGAM